MELWFRVETLVRSWLHANDSEQVATDAWRELESFLREEHLETPRASRDKKTSKREDPERTVPASIRQALTDLELAPGATLEEIKRAYRRQLVQYHPDRHSGDETRYSTAAEVTRRLTLAYQRLCDYYS